MTWVRLDDGPNTGSATMSGAGVALTTRPPESTCLRGQPMSDATPARKPISRRLRFEILRRDSHTCRYCGASAPDVHLTVDHVVPVALGGSDDPSNLVACCRDCNAGKSSTTPDAPIVADVAADALRWANAMRQALDIQRNEQAETNALLGQFDSLWLNWRTHNGEGSAIPRPSTWGASVVHWLSLGFTIDDLAPLIPIAMDKRHIGLDQVWRYFCGIVWRKYSQAQEQALKIVNESEV